MRKCLIITFDFWKDNYPKLPHSIASIEAKFHDSNFVSIEHYSYNLQDKIGINRNEIESYVSNHFSENYLEKINEYSYFALSAYSWSENLTMLLVNKIRNIFKGKIILGGYEITALNKDELQLSYPNVDYYIKGYSEKAFELIFTGKANSNILNEDLSIDDLISPILSGTLPLNTKKIYWESKRGCPYKCGFCEWGNAAKKKVYRFQEERLDKEIEILKTLNLEEINVLDATFLLNDRDNDILERLLTIPKCKITLQVRFENVDSKYGERFLSICEKYKDRINLEFGLQTIHEYEMKVLNRWNNLEKVETVMRKLNQRQINYLVTIIFAIPSQTVDSFDRTVEFIKKNGCDRYIAFPLQIPKNSELSRKKAEYKIKEHQGKSFSLSYVNESFSFSKEDWENMCKKAGEPFIGDPFEKKEPYYDMYFEKPGRFIFFERKDFKYVKTKDTDFIDLKFVMKNEEEIIYNLNTIQMKNHLKYSYFEGDIFELNSNMKYNVKLADSGNIYLISTGHNKKYSAFGK
jgi:radical SAM superfamily enzyme YgiQ (UPF0313 family)